MKSISSLSLRNYLKERKIDADVAGQFCKEVSFRINDKNYFALGFANDAGGYELRNSFFKGSTQPKDITSIAAEGDNLVLFEGFFDFLSYKTMMQKVDCVIEDYCILNSLSFIDKAKQILSRYQSLNVFFDRDNSGTKALKELKKANKNVNDESHLYKNHKDLNEWLIQFGLSNMPHLNKSVRQML